MAIEIHALDPPADSAWAREFLERTAGAARMVSRGRLHQCDRLPGFYLAEAGDRQAILHYRVEAGELEVVTLYVAAGERGKGHGSRLLEAARARAAELGCHRLWLVTTNDNLPALGFYRARGMRRVAVHRGAVDRARRELKPEIPLRGLGGAPIRDEIELDMTVGPLASGSGPPAAAPGRSDL